MAKRMQRVLVSEVGKRSLTLGYQGENDHTQVRIGCTLVYTDYPAAEVQLVVRPPVGDTYLAVVTVDGTDVVWDITASDAAHSGSGQYQLTFTVNGTEVFKSAIGSYKISSSLDEASGSAPTPQETWAEAMAAAMAKTVTPVIEASGAAQVALVEAKGDEVLDSIPADYSELTEEVSDLNLALKTVSDGESSIDISDYPYISCVVSANNTMTRSASKYMSRQIPINPIWATLGVIANSETDANVTFVTDALPVTPTAGTSMADKLATGETGRHIITAGTSDELAIPTDAKYIVVAYVTNARSSLPDNVSVKTAIKTILDGMQENDGSVVTFDTISGYGTDGVFAPTGSDPLSITLTVPFNGDTRNQIYTCIAKYEQDSGVTDAPTIIFSYGNNLNQTTQYILANKGDYATKEWRVIRYPGVTTNLTILINIPAGVTVTIKDFYNTYSDEISRTPYGIRINSHRRFFPTLMNPDTLPGVMMAVKSGACAMIQIPKRLSDGTWIFYHDDSLIYNDTYIRQTDGTELPSTYNGVLWSMIDFETANSWDWGISKGSMFAGTKPMTMEQFFTICGKTGIMPMLSVHPWPSASELGEIKAIARKCGVLNRLGIKCTVSYIAEAYSVFGNEIESYTVDILSGTQTASVINSAISAMDGLNGCTVRRVIELFASTAYNAYFGSSQYDPFKLISDAGYGCSIAQQSGAYHPTLPNENFVVMKGTDFDYWQSKGVTEYTYEYDWSNGLNW